MIVTDHCCSKRIVQLRQFSRVFVLHPVVRVTNLLQKRFPHYSLASSVSTSKRYCCQRYSNCIFRLFPVYFCLYCLRVVRGVYSHIWNKFRHFLHHPFSCFQPSLFFPFPLPRFFSLSFSSDSATGLKSAVRSLRGLQPQSIVGNSWPERHI